MKLNTKSTYRTYKSDAAPFFFYIDVIPIDLSHYEIKHHKKLLKNVQYNPIMPIPTRVDKVYNGEVSTLLRPRKPISFPISENDTALIKPNEFIYYGIKKLLYLTEIRGSEDFAVSLSQANAIKWWNNTRNIYGKLKTLEEDFAAFLRGYLYIFLTAKMNNDDLINAAISYCELIKNICNKRIQENYIIVEVKNKERIVDLYKMKKGKVFKTNFKREERDLLYPTFADIELIELETDKNQGENKNILNKTKNSKILKYIPLLIYDDLLECMLQNLNILENYEGELLDPSFLLEKGVIKIFKNENVKHELSKYSWMTNFEEIDINSILDSIEPTFI